MLATPQVVYGAAPETADPDGPMDPTIAPWPGEAAVTVRGSTAVLTAPFVGMVATCAGVIAQSIAPISPAGIWHGGAPPQTAVSLLNASALNFAVLVGEGAFWETQTPGLPESGIIFTKSIRS